MPVLTSSAVEFICGERRVHMQAGEAWIFDNWRTHNVLNPTPARRIHLVIDTVGSPAFWDAVARGRRSDTEHVLVPFDAALDVDIPFESVNHPVVMSPWEQEAHVRLILESVRDGESPEARVELRSRLEAFTNEWRAIWSVHGERSSGWDAYQKALGSLEQWIESSSGALRLSNHCQASEAIRQLLIRPALNPDLADESARTAKAPAPGPAPSVAPRPSAPFDRPLFIVCPPRSGSSLLFETLAQSPSVWTIGGESHALIEGIEELHPSARRWDSNRLTADAATPAVKRRLTTAFLSSVVDRDGHPPLPGATNLRLLEKTPKNALRVPLLAEVFPDARFVYLYRDPRETLSSMLDAWRSRRFVTYPDLPDWKGLPWSLLLVPRWRKLIGEPLAKIIAIQWKTTLETLLDDLEALPSDRWCVASYSALVAEPQNEIERLCRFLEIGWDRRLSAPLPNSRHTLSAPNPEKWRSNGTELSEMMPAISETAERARKLFANPPQRTPAEWRSPSPTVQLQDPARPHPLRSISTPSVGELLRQGGFSLLLSTYQSGKLITLRAGENEINSHFCSFPSPMGIAVGTRFLAFGTDRSIWHYRNQPDVARKLEPQGRVDGCFLPVRAHFTGDIRVHEMAWAGEELWIVNTRFSALCTLDGQNSFVPRWQPSFVSALTAEDRCHLNGLCVADGRVRWVTALGESDEPSGWRDKKASGGIVIDLDSNEIVARGLSMPHSPRWYRDRLWILESGKGEFGWIDLATGKVETVVQLPGFTRGLAFAGPYAIIGLSQVRESLFGGIPLTDRLHERVSGIWVVDIRSGQIAGFLRFQDLVQEIFDVQTLPGLRYPEMVEPGADWVKGSFVVPEAALKRGTTVN